MEELNLKELFNYVKERILVVIIIILATILLGCMYSIFLKTPMYRSDGSVVLVGESGTTTQTDVNLGNNLVSTYSDIVTSRKIVEKVIDKLDLNYSYGALKNNIVVTSKKENQIIRISVEDADGELAAKIANELIVTFVEEIKEIYKLQNVSVLDEAKVSLSPYNINVVRDLAIYTIVGIILALGIIFVIFYFDTTIKNADIVENKLDLPVIGIVPKVKYKEHKKKDKK